ncbi:uncharacterized protein LOC124494965 [Dermatophagoides farinae]|uniref:uncharacterized protein LOC124494965 n=1 Tax=Dermatophagoides farinae TaxID=6954 RepID=UPI003F6140EB
MSPVAKLIDDYCFKIDLNRTIWPSTMSKMNDSSIIGRLSGNFNYNMKNTTQSNCQLRAGLYPNEFVIIDNQQYVCTSSYEILAMLLQYCGCSINFIVSDENYGGFLTANGSSWTGILRLIDENKIDFIPHMLSRNNERNAILNNEFLMPQEHLVAILSQKRYLADDDPLKLFRAFSMDIWSLIFVSFICFTLSIYVMNKIQQKYNDPFDNKHHFNQQMTEFLLLHNMVDVFALFMGQEFFKWKNSICDQRNKLKQHNCRRRRPQHQRQHLYPIRILRNSLIFWIVCSLILRLLFATDILALLVSQKEQMINTFQQLGIWLWQHNDYRIFVEQQSTTGRNFRTKFARFDDRFVTIEYEDATTWHTIDKLINDRYFLIVDRERANLIADFYGNLKLHVSKEGLLSTMSNIAIRKNLNEPGKTHLLEVSKKIFHYGIWKLSMGKLIRYNWLKNEIKRLKYQEFKISNNTNLYSQEKSELRFKRNQLNNESKTRTSNATNASSLIHLYLLAIAISLIIFFLEQLHYILNRKNKK